MEKKYYALLAIFIIVLSSRLFFAFHTQTFSPEAYYTIRQAEHIKHNFFPLFNDPLSYGGRTLIYPPLFSYLIGFLGLFFPITIVGKILPNIFASSLIFVVYLIAEEITNNKRAALLAAFTSGFIPIFFSKTINEASVYSLAVPLMFFIIYAFMKTSHEKKYLPLFITSLLLLRILHPTIFLIILAFLIYLIIIRIENLRPTRIELELILFSTFLILWSLFIAFKNPLLIHGTAVIWQNIPKSILSQYFSQINILGAIYQVSIVPFVFGLYALYKYTFREKNKKIYFLVSFTITIFILLWLRLIQLNIGLMLLGVTLVLLLSKSYAMLALYLNKTKAYKIKNIILSLLIIAIIITSIIPSFSYAQKNIERNSIQTNEIKALEWLKQNSEKDDVVLGTIEEGYLITAIAERKNVADKNFLLIKDAEQRVDDIDFIYNTIYETGAIRLLNKYNVKYIIFSDIAKKYYKINSLAYTNSECFELVYNNPKIYKSLCVLE